LNCSTSSKYVPPSDVQQSDVQQSDVHQHITPYVRRKSHITTTLAQRFNYDDPELELKVSTAGIVVMGGTKKKLIDLLTDLGFSEIHYIVEFLGIYPYFCSATEILKNLSSSYLNPIVPDGLTENEIETVIERTRSRVIFIITRWLTTYAHQFATDFDSVLQLVELIKIIKDNKKQQKLQNLLQENIKCAKFDALTPRIVPKICKSPLLQFSVDDLAKQFCLFDQKRFCAIKTSELKGHNWSTFENTPNITRCIEFFNRVSYWCATEIVTKNTIKQRTRALKKIISLAKKCAVYHNYNSAFAITSALNFCSISRLRKTWKALPSKYKLLYNEMMELCKVEENYFPYKKLLLTQTPPLVPYLGVYLRDLTFLEVGNPTYLDDEKVKINYDKFRMIASVLLDFQKYQQIHYQFEENKQIQTALRYSMNTMDENELYEASCSIEPFRSSKSVPHLF